MVVREFKAQIPDDFAEKWFEATAADEHISIADAKAYYAGDEFSKFAERISGKVVTITENEYFVGRTDYFEKIDNNFVMHPEVFIEI